MRIKHFILLPAAVIMTAAELLSCRQLCGTSQYSVSGGHFYVSPQKDSVKLGDTLLITVSIPVAAKYLPGNSNDSALFDLSGFSNMIGDLRISVLAGYLQQSGALDSFSFVPIKGQISSTTVSQAVSSDKIISFREENGNFIFSCNIIARKKGVHIIIVSDNYQAEKKCTQASVSIVAGNSDNHLHYLQDIYFNGGRFQRVIEPILMVSVFINR